MRVEIKARDNFELLRKIDETLDEDVVEVYINRRPTKEIVVHILERAPNVRKISCPPSLYPKVSKKIVDALSKVGVELVPEGYPRGRPRKYGKKTLDEIEGLLRQGKGPKEISKRLRIPLRTVYYLIEKSRAWESK